jgi:hypothetical protein
MSPTEPNLTASNLIPGRVYRVTAAFTDYDGKIHPAGETWLFVNKGFQPHEDGLALIIEQDGQQNTLRLQWRAETQQQIIEHFGDYVEILPETMPSIKPGSANPTNKTALWTRIVLGGLFLSLILVGAAIFLLSRMVYPDSSGIVIKNIMVSVIPQFSVRLGHNYVLEVQITNTGDLPQKLDSIEINSRYLAGAIVDHADPAYVNFSKVTRSVDYFHFDFQREIAAKSTLPVKFYLTAEKTGDYSGEVVVCINSPTQCTFSHTRSIIRK